MIQVIKERLHILALPGRAVVLQALCVLCCLATESRSIGTGHAFQKFLMKTEMVKSWTGTSHCLKASCRAVLE